MQLKTRLHDRLISAILAFVMLVGFFPPGVIQAHAAENINNITDAVTANGGAANFQIELDKTRDSVPAIKTLKYSRIGCYFGTYSGYGLSGYGFCADHTKGAPSGGNHTMNVTITESYKVTDPLLINTFYCAASPSRDVAYAKRNLIPNAESIFPNFGIDFSGLTEAEWRQASQYAVWMARKTDSGKQMLAIDTQMEWKNGKVEYTSSDDAFDIVYTEGVNSNTLSKQRVLKTAVAIHLWASYLTEKEGSMSNRTPGSVSRPIEYDFLKDRGFYPTDSVVDFTSAGDNNDGNIATAYEKVKLNDEGIIKQTIGGKEYYVTYWMFGSKTQPSGSDEAQITLGGNYPSGTVLSYLDTSLDKAFMDASGIQQGDRAADIYNDAGTPGTSLHMSQYTAVTPGTGYTLDTDKATGVQYCWPVYFKVCIPVDSVTEGDGSSANIAINMVQPSVYKYDLYMGANENSKWQPYLLGDISDRVESIGIIKWGESNAPGSFTIYKKDESGKALSGVTFTAHNDDYNKDIKATTDQNGAARFDIPAENLKTPGGAYTVWKISETVRLPGYEDTDVNLTVTVSDIAQSFTVTNKKKPGSEVPGALQGVIRKVDAVTKEGLAGAVFNVRSTETGYSADFTTDSFGYLNLQWANPKGANYVAPGTYMVTEVSAPEGYNLDSDGSKMITLTYNSATGDVFHTGDLIFQDSKKPWIGITKTDEQNQLIAGAEFDVYLNGTLFDHIGPMENGTYEYHGPDGSGLQNGLYRFVETAAPAGYLKTNEAKEIYVNVNNTNAADSCCGNVGFQNEAWAEVEILKQSMSDPKTPLAGAVFTVSIDGQKIEEVITGDDGYARLTYADFGKYLDDNKDQWTVTVEEIAPPAGYLLPEVKTQTMELKRGEKKVSFVFEDAEYPAIKIRKLDAETGDPLAGAYFDVQIDGNNVPGGPFVSDQDGYVTIDYDKYREFLAGHDYDGVAVTVTETKAPENYNRDHVNNTAGWSITKHLSYNQSLIEFNFSDHHYRNIRVTKKDADTKWLLEGATYKLHCVSLEDPQLQIPADRYGTTDKTGTVIFENLPNGNYEITETKAPSGYQGSDVITRLTVRNTDPMNYIEVEYENEPLTGLTIRKVDSVAHQPIANAEFNITGHTNDGQYVEWLHQYTDANGLITLENIKPGQYTITEISVPKGFVLDSTPRTIRVDEQHQSTIYEFENNADGMLYVLKLDSLTKLPVPGVTFDVSTAGGRHIANITTGPNGYATLAGLEPGAYVVKEILAPDHLIVDPTPQTFEVSATDSGKIYELVFYNNEKTNLLIQKIDMETGKPLEGAYFDIRSGDGKEIAMNERTDENGLILLPNLDPGIYILEEVRAPEGYILQKDEQRLVLEANKTKRVIIENSKKGGITICKVDADTDAPLPGAAFELYSMQDQLLGTFTDEDKDGYIHISGLEPGQYFIKEIKAPNGYLLNSELIKVRVEEFKVASVKVQNSQTSMLTITKIDADTGVPLAGAGIRVTTMNGELVRTGKTDENGKLVLTGLNPGWYKVQEYEAPKGYILNNTEFTVEIVEGKPAAFEIKNTAEHGLLLKKVDAETMKPLAGATFEIYTLEDKLIGEYVTDTSGTINTIQLAPGHYKVKEVKAPEGYLLDESWRYFEMTAGETTKITFKDYKQPVILIEKLDSKTGEHLAGAVFEVKTADGKTVIGTYTTDSTGMVYTLPVNPGAYTVSEIKAPKGYALNKEIKPVNVEAGHMPEVVRFYNDREEITIIKKTDSQTGEPLAGATFRIYDMEGNSLGEYTTDADGIALVPKMEPGSYAVREVVAPAGYMIDNNCKMTFVINPGQPANLTFTDTKKPGIQVLKLDAKTGNPLTGAQFTLFTVSGEALQHDTTDESGMLVYDNLQPGTYVLQETKAPDGYQIDKQNYLVTVKAGAAVVVTATNTPNSNLNLKKTDENGNPLAGATFTVTRKHDNKVMGRFTTDSTGCLTVENLAPGEYVVTEVVPPEGYMIDTESKTVTIANGEQSYVSFINRKLTGIQILKVDSVTKAVLAGAVFEVRDANGTLQGTYTTGVSGMAATGELKPGVYTVKETKAPDGYSVAKNAEQTVTVTTGETAKVTFENEPQNSLQILKVDAQTNKPLAGAAFRIVSARGTEIGNYTTDENGLIVVNGLAKGYYMAIETSAPEGYQKPNEAKLIYLNGQLVTVTIPNTPNMNLVIHKVDAETKQPLTGAEFEVKDLDGKTVFSGATDKTGMLQTTTLPAGYYTVQETKAPAGYVLNGNAQTVQLEAGKSTSITVENQPEASLTIRKVDALSKQPLAGASFQVNADNGTISKTVTTDAAGLAFVSGLTAGSYSMVEIKAPEGYVLNPEHIDFNVSADGDNVVTVENYQSAGLVIRKVDKATGKLLQGAKFTVASVDGNIAHTGVTDASGIILTGALEPGTYIVTEIQAPEGYQLDSKPQTVELKLNETRTVTFEDAPLTSLLIEKVDALTKETLANARFKITRLADNKVITEGVTDVDGLVLVNDLEPGRYLVEEIEAPKGYIMETEPIIADVEMGKVAHVTFLNMPQTGIIIDSIDKDSKDPLPGSTFEIWIQNGKLIYTLTTDSTGTVQTPALTPGFYVIKQTIVQNGYTVVLKEQTVEVKAGNIPVHITFEAEKGYTLRIENVDELDRNITIVDAEFKVTKIDGTVIGTFLTDINGQIMIPDLAPGWYVVTQTIAGKGYVINTQSFNIEVKAGTIATVLVRSTPMSGVIIQLQDYDTHAGLSGAIFEVWRQNGNMVDSYVTDRTGHIETGILPAGYYVIKQIKAPDGYLINNEEKTIQILPNGQPVIVTYTNMVMSNLTIRYEDASSAAGIVGAVFEVFEQNGKYVGDFITESGGVVSTRILAAGYYTIKLKAAPDGYTFKAETQTIEVRTGATSTVIFRGTSASGLQIELVDALNQHLSGGEFEVRKIDGTVVGTFKTEFDGCVLLNDLEAGYYVIKQIKAPDGYAVETAEKTIEVKAGVAANITFVNQKHTGAAIYTLDSSTNPVAGVRIEIREQNGNVIGVYVSDSTGMINVPAMTPGYYVIKILNLPDGYSITSREQTIQVTAGENVRLTFDIVKQGSLVLKNLNKADESPVSGAHFTLTTIDGTLISDAIIVDHEGVAALPALEPGYYNLVQTKAPDGFSLSTEKVQVKIVAGESTVITFYNGAQASLQMMSVDSNGIGIAGMKLVVTTMNGERLGEFTTDKSGIAMMNNLEPGHYIVMEVKAPEGYVINNKPQVVEIKSGMMAKATFEHSKIYGLQILTTIMQTNQPVAGVSYSIEKLNGERMGTYTSDKQGLLYVDLVPDTYVVKQVSVPDGYEAETCSRNVTVLANKTTRIEYMVRQLSSMRIRIVDATTGQGIYNMRLLLKTEAGDLVGEYITNDMGYIRLDKELADGYYTLEAISVPDGYRTDDIPRTIQILNGETTEVNWSFSQDVGQIQVVVRSTDYNNMLDLPEESLLSGAVFEIVNPDTYVVVDTITTGADGVAASAPLPLGRYIVRQKSASAYYAGSDKETEVKLKVANDVVRVEYYNRSLTVALKTEIQSNKNVSVGSFMRVDFPAVNNESDTRLDDFYWQIKIPTDCARAGTLYTGSWNTKAWYKVYYKTNMNDFREMSADLLSTNQNQLDLSSTALNLQTGEYVTDIRLSFGTVPANFKVSVKPSLYLYVMPNVYNGYKCIVRAEVGGKLSNNWQTATASWTTNILKTTTLPGRLPTTGF